MRLSLLGLQLHDLDLLDAEVLGEGAQAALGPEPSVEAVVLKDPEHKARALKIGQKFAAVMLLGTAACTVGGAALWRDHRVLGGMLGLLLVGPAAGTGAAYALTIKDADQLRSDALAKQKQLPAGPGGGR